MQSTHRETVSVQSRLPRHRSDTLPSSLQGAVWCRPRTDAADPRVNGGHVLHGADQHRAAGFRRTKSGLSDHGGRDRNCMQLGCCTFPGQLRLQKTERCETPLLLGLSFFTASSHGPGFGCSEESGGLPPLTHILYQRPWVWVRFSSDIKMHFQYSH